MNAVTNGEAARVSSFHGRIVASRKMEPTKKIAIRTITEFAAFVTARSGSSDSAAAIVAISAPTIEKMTVTMPTVIAPKPSGMNPPWAHRLEKSIDLFGHKPRTKSEPSAMNTMIAATLMPANQNSNSPKDDTENRLVAVIKIMRTKADEPQRDVDPVLDDLRARDGLEADDDHPEIPVQPADREAGPVAQRVTGIVGERSGRRVGHGHLGQHAYDHDDQHAGHARR